MVKIKRSSDGQFFWVLYAKNGEALCTSEMFKQKVKAIKSAGVMIELVEAGGLEIGDFSADLRLAMYADENDAVKKQKNNVPNDNRGTFTLTELD